MESITRKGEKRFLMELDTIDTKETPLDVFIASTPDGEVYIRLTFHREEEPKMVSFLVDAPAAFRLATGIMMAVMDEGDSEGSGIQYMMDMEHQA